MIKISGQAIDPQSIPGHYLPGSLKDKMINSLTSSETSNEYSSMKELEFELNMRMSIIDASRLLARSGMLFRIFDESYCNPAYWNREDNGGFLLKDGVSPLSAINNIFKHGSRYGTECATAMVIVYYKAAGDIFPEELFNQMFPAIRLMNWQDIDSDLGISYHREPGDLLPGDCRYFKNPDVDPLTPEWQGENTIDLGNGTYYGHGIGIAPAEGIIRQLNKHRIEGSEVSAYLMDSATRPDFKYLASMYPGNTQG